MLRLCSTGPFARAIERKGGLDRLRGVRSLEAVGSMTVAGGTTRVETTKLGNGIYSELHARKSLGLTPKRRPNARVKLALFE